jgi:hypothetical protein
MSKSQSFEFVSVLESEVHTALERLGRLSASGEASRALKVERLLMVALKNELEAAEVAATWLITTSELEVKLALARQCGDEARHYRLISERLRAMGIDALTLDPREGGYSPLYRYLISLQSTPERVAAGQFAREGIALVRNECFISFCELQGDHETAALYRDKIQPDERHHHQLGRGLLEKYAVDQASQTSARNAALRTLELAEEIQEMARLKAGVSRAPGC